MALIRCPECGHKVSSFAATCPDCGYPLIEDPMEALDIVKFLATSDNEAFRMGIANNPTTPREVLKKLAADDDIRVRYYAAGNLSTPPESLGALLLGRDHQMIRMRAAANTATPPEALAAFASDIREYDLAIGRAESPFNGVERPPEGVMNYWHLLEEVARNPSTPPHTLADLNWSESKNVREQVAGNPSTPPSVLISIATNNSENEWLRYIAAENPAMPAKNLAELADNGSRLIRQGVAKNPITPQELLVALSSDEETLVQVEVAANPHTPPETLAWLAGGEKESLRTWVAGNVSSPPSVLIDLALRGSFHTKKAVARNPAAPPEALAALTQVKDSWERGLLRDHVSSNPNTPPEVLSSLATNKEKFARIVENVEEDLFDVRKEFDKAKQYCKVQANIAGNPSTPPEVITDLAKSKFLGLSDCGFPSLANAFAWTYDEARNIRESAASNPSAPIEVLICLAEDAGSACRSLIAGNPSTSPEVLARILKEDLKYFERQKASGAAITAEDEEDEYLDPRKYLPDFDIDRYLSRYTGAAFRAASSPSITKLNMQEYRQCACELYSIEDAGEQVEANFNDEVTCAGEQYAKPFETTVNVLYEEDIPF